MRELAEQNSTYVEGAASCQHFMRRFQLSSSHNMSTSVHLLNVHVAKTVVSLLRVVDAHIPETKVERLLRKMMLKLISATLPVTLNPSMQFLVLILINLIKSYFVTDGMAQLIVFEDGMPEPGADGLGIATCN